ncbi:hypothetical protein NBRC110019_18440 [Neptunitalea chrysea]|uniref:GSCFA domain-containing protein n=1 Tax=Neptunitalea chrysea TaxID=1647581 RepID=A0A9W6EUN3_9FLAO|nr:GSCFA domain-containing protein [Neptunitalea chrysea]GLB52804.1 hypothetical protein NBRC110019_18440 [Neptunitalea chrysea]
MKLQTNVPIEKVVQPIGYEDTLLLMGSCFVTNIGEKLANAKFKHTVNPFGVIFQPLAIEKLIERAINEVFFTENDIFFYNEQWHSYEVHSQCSHTDKEVFLSRLNNTLRTLKASLQAATCFVLTLGTAWVYRFIETDRLVANCHKVPQKKFLKELLSVEDIQISIEAIIGLLRSVNPTIRVITTVSPVRHLKDGFIENMRSKSHLITALHKVVEPRKQIYYFPSYEIMIDELRDYRFYKDDMVHPSALAVDYIWERFTEVWISEETRTTMNEVESISKGLAHRPFNPNSEAHQLFLQKLADRVAALEKENPFIQF